MPKEIVVNVKVQDDQFQQFIRNFNAFSAKIQNLNTQFNQIQQSVQKANQQASTLSTTMRGLLNTTKSLASTVAGITTHFMKWSVLVGSVGALLGMGGGLFGIERLASSILQKRRMVLGLGGDYGRTQASMIYSQSLLGSPQSVLQNIRMGLGGSMEQMRPLMALGIPFGTQMSPDQVLEKILPKISDIMRNAKPGTELMVAKAYGFDKIFTDPMDLMRLTTEEGRRELAERQKLIEAHKKELELSKPAQKAWSDLEIQFQIAKTAMQNVFGERLAALAEPLKKLSEGLVNVVKALMEAPIIQTMLKQVADWLNQFANYLKSEKVQQDIDNFLKSVGEWASGFAEFKKKFLEFADTLEKVVIELGDVWHKLQVLNNNAAGFGGLGTEAGNWVRRHLGLPEMQAPNAPNAAPPPQTNAPSNNVAPGDPAQRAVPNPFSPPPSSQHSSTQNYSNSSTKFAAWQGAAGRAAPGNTYAGSSTQNANFSYADNRGGSRSGGALDIDNWQMTRTASLVVRNTPGSNMYMTATGMAG